MQILSSRREIERERDDLNQFPHKLILTKKSSCILAIKIVITLLILLATKQNISMYWLKMALSKAQN